MALLKARTPGLRRLLGVLGCVHTFGLVLAGCGAEIDVGPLLGKWEFDRPFTEARLPEQGGEGPAGKMYRKIRENLLDRMENVTIEITRDEIISLESGRGKAQPYEVIERPGPNQWRIRSEDDEIQTLEIVEGRLGMPMTGNISGTFYLRRVGE